MILPVKMSLIWASLSDLTGLAALTDVGGADKPILVVAEAPGFGARTNIVVSATMSGTR
jgi:hypothetical protein